MSAARLAPLTDREREVLEAVGRGLTFLSVRTILVAGAVATGGGVWLVGHAAASWQLLCAYTLLGAGMSLTGPITLTTALIRAVPAGSRLRARFVLVEFRRLPGGGAQLTTDVTFELEGGVKSPCVVQSIARYYT